MAHAALHFALGMTVGMAATAPRLRRAWQAGKAVAPATARWLASAWAMGVFAIVPSLLRYAGVPESFCGGWWMNLFLFHPLINAGLPQSAIAGSTAFMGLLVLQYLIILAAIARVRRGPWHA
jgi:hypothetical protein